MKRFCLIIYFLSFLLPVIAQPVKNINQTDKNGLKQGAWQKKDANGKIKYTGQFKDDKPQGRFIHYYPTGEIKAHVDYILNGIAAKVKYFHPNGKLQAEGIYVEEKKDSTWQMYDDQGNLIAIEDYVNGIQWGKAQTFYPKAGLCEDAVFENGVKNGPFSTYFENGKMKESGTFVKGNPEGKFNRFHSNGQIAAEGFYVNGKQAGRWKYFDENGIPTFDEIIEKGEKKDQRYYNGTFEENYPNDIPKSSYTYKNGMKNGPFIEYYNKGSYKFVMKKGDKGQEERVQVLEGQMVKCKGNYLNDKYDGEILFFTEEGKTDHKEIWKNGEKIK